MSDTAEHCEPRMFPHLKTLTHPGKEVSQRIVPAPDTLWNTGTSARERQCTNAVRSDDYIRVCLGETSLRCKNIGRTLLDAATHNFSTSGELQGRNFNPDVQFSIDVLPNIGVKFPGSLENDECSRLRNSEINGLP